MAVGYALSLLLAILREYGKGCYIGTLAESSRIVLVDQS